MITFIFAVATLSHTPIGFHDNCATTDDIILDDVNVSQVHYMRMQPGCNYTFKSKECVFNRISMHRLEPGIQTGFLQANKLHTETMQVKEHEPFTLTPYVTTVELDDVTVETDASEYCTIVVGSNDTSILSFVVGIEEEFFEDFTLFFKMPLWTYRIQWQWAYANMKVWWFFPALVYAGLLVGLSVYTFKKEQYSSYVVFLLFLFCVIVDGIVPSILSGKALGTWPTSGIWVGVATARALVYWLLLVMIMYVERAYMFPTEYKLVHPEATTTKVQRKPQVLRILVLLLYLGYLALIILGIMDRLPLRTVLIACLSVHFFFLIFGLCLQDETWYKRYVPKTFKFGVYPRSIWQLYAILDISQFVLLVLVIANVHKSLEGILAFVAIVGIIGCIYKVSEFLVYGILLFLLWFTTVALSVGFYFWVPLIVFRRYREQILDMVKATKEAIVKLVCT